MPHVVYKGERLRHSWTKGFDACTYGTTKSGWMEAEQFASWFEKTFIPGVSKLNGQKLLFLDGHHSHMSLRLFDLATKYSILLLKLIPHSSHILQPLDVGVFRTVKAMWKKILDEHFKQNKFRDVTKDMFPTLLNLTVAKGFRPENVTAGFRAAGLYPLNYEEIKEKLKIGTCVISSTPSTPTTSAAASTPTTSAAANYMTPITPSTNRRKASIDSTPCSTNTAKRNQMSAPVSEVLEHHITLLTDISNQTVSTLVNSVESIFKIKYKMPEKEFNNTTFQAGIIMNGAENRAAHEKKLKEIQDKKDQVEANKKKELKLEKE
jgi:hypothetical protein